MTITRIAKEAMNALTAKRALIKLEDY